jgi:hypothetical protein
MHMIIKVSADAADKNLLKTISDSVSGVIFIRAGLISRRDLWPAIWCRIWRECFAISRVIKRVGKSIYVK